MSTQAQQLNTIQDVQDAVKNCAAAIATMAASIRSEVLLGNISGFSVDELVQLEAAARAVQRTYEITSIYDAVLEGDFGTARDEAFKLALAEIIGQNVESTLAKLGGIDPNTLSGGARVTFDLVNSTIGGLAVEALGTFALAASDALTDAVTRAIVSGLSEAELDLLRSRNEVLSRLLDDLAAAGVDAYDELGNDVLATRLAQNAVEFANDAIVEAASSFGFRLVGVDFTGAIRKIDRLVEFSGGAFAVDLNLGRSQLGSNWTFDGTVEDYGRALIGQLSSSDYILLGEARNLLGTNVAGARAASFANNSGFASITAAATGTFMVSDGGNHTGSRGNDVLIGAGFAQGKGGNDLIVMTQNSTSTRALGGDGNDVMIGSTGNDNMDGGSGNDRLDGGRGNDTLKGDSGEDNLFGGEGSDSLDGGSSDDFLEGGKGADTIEGGGGNDIIHGGELGDPSGDGANKLTGGGGADNIFGGDAGDTIEGGSGRDLLVGNGGSDSIKGDAGSDVLYGGEQNGSDDGASDTLDGGAGSDSYFVSNGDVITGGDRDGTVTFNGIRLTGGKSEEEENCDDPGTDNESDDNKEYKGEDNGEIYRKSGNNLTVTFNGATLTIEGWSDGDLGITLEDEDPGDGDDCDPPPDEFASPLVLDLDGDGIELIRLSSSAAFFDIDRDGVRERTGWASGDDGLLALDRNGNGIIDNADELFGYGETFSGRGGVARDAGRLEGPSDLDIRFDSGFDQLTEFDTNLDGVVSAADLDFGTLLIWRDVNEDGVSEEDELFSLTDAGVASISLDVTAVEERQDGHLITDAASFVTTGGETRDVKDIWFQFNQYDTRFDGPEDLDPALLDLPDIRAGGDLKPLRLAMAENAELRGLVEEFAALTGDDLEKVVPLVDKILFSWAGVRQPDKATGRGVYVDSRYTEVMENFADTQFQQWSGLNPRPQAGGAINEQYLALSQSIAVKLIAQTEIGQQAFPEVTYENDQFLILAAGTDSQTVLQRLVDSAPTSLPEKIAHYATGLRVVDKFYESFTDVGTDPTASFQFTLAVDQLLQNEGIDHRYLDLVTAMIGSDGDDSFLTNTTLGRQYNSAAIGRETVVVTGAGDDEVFLGGARQVIYWGSGQGNDTLRLDPFSAQGFYITPRVEIRLFDLNPEDVTLVRVGSQLSTDGALENNATGEQLVLRNLISSSTPTSGSVRFADGTLVNFSQFADQIAALAETPTDGDDLLIQRIGTTLDGGAGNDDLRGSAGETVYLFGIGSGSDVITDTADGLNSVNFGPGVSATDLEFDRAGIQGRDLVIRISGTTDQLIIKNQYRDDDSVISTFSFETDPPLQDFEIRDQFLQDGTGNDTVLGFDSDDFFGGNSGNDLIRGFDGSDFYVWGPGDGSDIINDGGFLRRDADNEFIEDIDIVVVDYDFSELVASEQGSSIVLLHEPSGDTLEVQSGIESFSFNDLGNVTTGQLRTLIQVGADPDVTVGTLGDDELLGDEERDNFAGLAGNDTIIGEGADDKLQGNEGNDTIDAGAGNDEVTGDEGEDLIYGGGGDDDLNGGLGVDLVFGGVGNDTLTAGDQVGDGSSSFREANTLDAGAGNDAIYGGTEADLLIGGAGNDIIVGDFGDDDYFGGLGNDIFVDRDGNNTWQYNLGDGDDLIFTDEGFRDLDVLNFGPGISQSDLTFSFAIVSPPENTNLFFFDDDQGAIRIDIAQGGSVTLAGGTFDPVGTFGVLRFNDGSSLSFNDYEPLARAPLDADQLFLTRTNGSDDVFEGGGGDDTFRSNFGDLRFVYNLGDGADTIQTVDVNEFNNPTGQILFGTGILPADLTFERAGDSLEDLIVTLSDGGSVTIEDNFQVIQDFLNEAGLIASSYITEIQFADDPAATLTAADILASQIAPTDGDDVQIGSLGNDTFDASLGNDVMQGLRGSDAYNFGIGDGQDSIIETADDLLYQPFQDFGEGFSGPFDLSTLRETDTVRFGTGVTLVDLTVSQTGTSLRDMRIEINGTTDTLTIENQLFPEANFGRSTFPFDEGFFPPILDLEILPAGMIILDPNDPGGQGDAELGPNGEVSAEYWAENAAAQYGSEPLFQNGIERFAFEDGTILTRDEMAALISNVEDEGSQTISSDANGGTLDGGAGNDTLLGDVGDDTYILRVGTGNDIASDLGGDDTVAIDPIIIPEDVAFSRIGPNGDDLLIEIGGEERSAITFEGQFADDGREVEQIVIQGGQTVTAQMIREMLLDEASTNGNDEIIGFETDDTINARDGDDIIEARGGNDLVDGGDGRDTVRFRGPATDYEVATEGPFTLVTDLTGRDGETRLLNVEELIFTDPDTGAEEVQELVANTAPVAGPVALDGREDTALVIATNTLLVAASDPDGASVSLQSVGNSVGGSAEIDAEGRVVFVPDADRTEPAQFDYTVVDAGGLTATAVATISLAPVNDAPNAVADAATGDEDAVITLLASDILANDSDPDGDSLTIVEVEADLGTAVLTPAGDIEYTPVTDFFGPVVLTYTISDGAETAIAEISLTISPVNDGPVAVDDVSTVREDTPATIFAADLVSNDTDVEEDTLSIFSVGSAIGGSVELDTNGDVLFAPDENFNGSGSFSYVVTDGAETATATVDVEILAVNDDPSAGDDDGFETGAGVALVLTAADLLSNDSDVDGDVLGISNVASGAGGLAALDGNGGVLFTPDAEFAGTASFDYFVTDGAGGEDVATVSIEVVVANAPPVVAVPLPDVTSDEDQPVLFGIPAGTFDDPDGDLLSLTASLSSGDPLPAWLSFDGSDFTGQPPQDFNGALQIAVTASDANESVTDTFNLTIDPVNDRPVAADDSVIGIEDTALTILASDVLANDSDVDGDTLSIVSVVASSGVALVTASGDIAFTSAANENGEVTLTYTVSDGDLTDTAEISVDLAAVNDAPVVGTALPDVSSAEDVAVLFDIPGDAFVDVDSDELVIAAALVGGDPLPAWLSFDGTTFSGTPPLNFNGTLEIEVSASDGLEAATFTFTLTIDPVNDAPVAEDDQGGTVAEGESLTISAADLLANDSDVDGDPLQLLSVTDGTGGTASLDGAGDVVFTADTGFSGTATFTYSISDGNGGGDEATVSVVVEALDAGDPYEGFRRGTEGDDVLFGRFFSSNQIFAAGGNDIIFGGFRSDHLAGGEGNDVILGRGGRDTLEGNEGQDWLLGSSGSDLLVGGSGSDALFGGWGEDRFEFANGDGGDTIFDFEVGGRYWWGGRRDADTLVLDVEGVGTASGALALAQQSGNDVLFDFGSGDTIRLKGTSLSDLNEDLIEIA